MLTIWGRRTSSNVQALMWGIGELGLPYERHDAGHRYGGLDTPEFRAMNPNGACRKPGCRPRRGVYRPAFKLCS
jgi:glutathione S-transferase